MSGQRPSPHRQGSIIHSLSNIGETLTRDLDEQTFKIMHPRHIPLVKSPLIEDAQDEKSTGSGSNSLKEASTNVMPQSEGQELDHKRSHIDDDPDDPPLRYEHESSTIQLFYDLFFVANLTTFTSEHAVTNGTTLAAYVGFFTLLWFTWFQVALFDIRFGNDSAFERFCKAIQFGVMVGLAVESGTFEFGNFEENQSTFQSITLILMVSRFVLAIQYIAAAIWLRKYKKSRIPLIIHIITLAVSGFIFLGLYFGFGGAPGERASYGWWVVLPIEALIILFVSGHTSFLNFRRTNIIERLGLLTLIILGEGIMQLAEAVVRLAGVHDTFGPDVIGLIICSVLTIYFTYMLYFDQIESEKSRIGTFRSHLWTLFHFPFHVCILLLVAGFSELTIWRKMMDWINFTNNMILAIPEPKEITEASMEEWAHAINTTLSNFWGFSFSEASECIAKHWDNMTILSNTCLLEAEGAVIEYLAETYKVELPETEITGNKDIDAAIHVVDIYSTVFLYFFICAGLTLIFLGVLFILGKRTRPLIEWVPISVRFIVGTVLCLLATMYASFIAKDEGAFSNYIESAWMLPTVLLAYLLVLGLDAIVGLFSRHKVNRRRGSDQISA